MELLFRDGSVLNCQGLDRVCSVGDDSTKRMLSEARLCFFPPPYIIAKRFGFVPLWNERHF